MRQPEPSIVRLLALITLMAGLVTAAIGVTIVQTIERRNLIEEATNQNLAAAQRMATRIDDRVVAIGAKLRVVAAQERVLSMDPRVEGDLAVALRISRDLDELALYDATGRPVTGVASARLVRPDDLPHREDFADGQMSESQEWATDTDQSSVEIVVPVEDPPGTVVGALVARAPVALVAEASAGQLQPGGTAFVTDLDGWVHAHRDQRRVVDDDRFDVRIFEDAPSQMVAMDDEPSLVAGSRLSSLPGWVVVERARDEVTRPAEVTLGGFTGIFLAVVAVVIAVLLLAGRRLLHPLGSMAHAVDQVARGDLDTRVQPSGVGEIRVLEDGFNRMASSLQDRQQALESVERQARDSEERLRLLIEGVTDYAIFQLNSDGRIRSWNTGAVRLLAYEPQDILDEPLAHIFTPREANADPLRQAEEQGSVRTEGWCHRRGGIRFWAQISITALSGEGQAGYDGFAVILHDLTDREMAQAAVRQALHREKLAAAELRRAADLKDEFLAIAAHEIRTPLSAILGATEVLARDEGWADEERRQFDGIIRTYAEDMRDIVERLLDFTRLQAGRVRYVPERFTLQEAVESYLTPLARHLEDHRIVVEVPETEIVSDPALLRHIVTNLVSNAAKFSPVQSTITVAGEIVNDRLEVSVSDEGRGVAPEDRDRVFELFRRSSQSDDPASGTGIGLAIVKRYVEMVGGDIRLDSSPGVGSTFTVCLPLAMSTEPAGRNGPRPLE